MIHQRHAQSLLEAILAIAIIIASTIAATTLIVTTVTSGQRSTDNVVAQNYAREGIEIIRGIRDSNWLKRSQNICDGTTVTCGNGTATTFKWDDDGTTQAYQSMGAAAPGRTYATLFSAATSSWTLVFNPSVANQVIAQPASASYVTQQCAGTCTPTYFSRLITIVTVQDTFFAANDVSYLDVTSKVTWQDHGSHQIIARARLYDWR